MTETYPVDKMVSSIRSIKRAAEELRKLSGGIQAVDRNVGRILASVKMLEINISDAAEIIGKAGGNKDG